MKISLKRDWVYIVLVIVGVWALGMLINGLWGAASKQPGACWFNKLIHGTGARANTGPAAQGAKDAPSECCGPVPASAGVCCVQRAADLSNVSITGGAS